MGIWLEENQTHMASHFSFYAFEQRHMNKEKLSRLFKAGFDEIARVENLLTDFRDSPFNKINDHAGERPVEVCPEIFKLIEKSFEISGMTNGAFDISYASIGKVWRDAKRKNEKPDADALKLAAGLVDFKKILLDKKNLTIYLPHPQMRIGLGGIGKGYAVDQAFQILRSNGVENFMVNGAGDIRVHSNTGAPRPWRLGIRNPFSKDPTQSMGQIEIKNGAMATSGNYIKFIGDKEHHHIHDPKSGKSPQEIASATVLTEEAVMADPLATSLMIMQQEQGLELLNKYNYYGGLVTNQGKSYLSNQAVKSLSSRQRRIS